MLIKWIASELHACGHVRGEIVAREINNQMTEHRMDVKTSVSVSDYPKTDIMVFQRHHSQEMLARVEKAKSMGIKTIFEVDDDMFHMPESFKKAYDVYKKPKVRQTMLDIMDTCDAVTCSTEELKLGLEFIMPNKPIYVVANSLDVDAWAPAYAERAKEPKSDVITIGWMASGSHKMDAPLIEPALQEIMEAYQNVRLHFIGWIGFNDLNLGAHKHRILVEDWVPIHMLPYVMSEFDINLCPLIDHKFNRSKSNLKYLQGGALGIPSICSDLHPYKGCIDNNVDGLLADSPASWLACLSELVENSDLRLSMGQKAREKVLAQYDVKNNFLQWINVFERVKRM